MPLTEHIRNAFATLFLLFVMGSAFAGRLPFAVVFLYLGASVVAFFAYLLDKSAARNNQWRTPENTLQMLGLIGGWPGALIAQKLLRHKTRKLSFQVVFWVTVLLNCCGLAWLFSPSGSTACRVDLFLSPYRHTCTLALPPGFPDDVASIPSLLQLRTGPSQNRAGAIYAHGSSHGNSQSLVHTDLNPRHR